MNFYFYIYWGILYKYIYTGIHVLFQNACNPSGMWFINYHISEIWPFLLPSHLNKQVNMQIPYTEPWAKTLSVKKKKMDQYWRLKIFDSENISVLKHANYDHKKANFLVVISKNWAELEKQILKANIKISIHSNMFNDFTSLQCLLGFCKTVISINLRF